MIDREVMQMALEALESLFNWQVDHERGKRCGDAVAALRAALEQPEQRKPFDILAITTAYEQGVGKGHQAQSRSVEIENPYAPGECQQAWALGYDEGKKQAASKAAHGIGEKP